MISRARTFVCRVGNGGIGDLRSAVSAGSETRAEHVAGSETRAEHVAGAETRAEHVAGSETRAEHVLLRAEHVSPRAEQTFGGSMTVVAAQAGLRQALPPGNSASEISCPFS